MRDALDTLIFGGDRMIRVYGPVQDTSTGVEVVMKDKHLRNAMLIYSRNVFLLSILISLFTATLVFFAINRILIKPIRKLTGNMQQFSADPENPQHIFVGDGGRDELAIAGRHLTAMQLELQKTLKQQRNLAALGLAVSKINHDMRNILASAQLMSDRLVDIDDPMVKRFAPKLLRTIDRAVGYTTEVLSYGQASESAPRRRLVLVTTLIEDVRDMLAIDPQSEVEFVEQIGPGLEVDADNEQLFRVIHNLCRNALQALIASNGMPTRCGASQCPPIASAASSASPSTTPVPACRRKHDRTSSPPSAAPPAPAAQGSVLRSPANLVLAHGGTIALVEKPSIGTQFRIEIPDRPVSLEDYRGRSQHEK
jgi:signal transduction histidine kinase